MASHCSGLFHGSDPAPLHPASANKHKIYFFLLFKKGLETNFTFQKHIINCPTKHKLYFFLSLND